MLFYFSRLAGQGIVPNVPTPTAPIAAPHELMLENVPAAVAASSALLASLASPFPGCGGGVDAVSVVGVLHFALLKMHLVHKKNLVRARLVF